MTSRDNEHDHVDAVVEQWRRERPDLDTTAMASLGRLARVQRLVTKRLEDVFAEHELESWEFDVLATLRRAGPPHALTPGSLLEQMMLSSGAMTNRIDRLAARGLVERRPHPDDGRAVLVALTDQGFERIERAVTDHVANELDILSHLDESQQAELDMLLRRLLGALDPEA